MARTVHFVHYAGAGDQARGRFISPSPRPRRPPALTSKGVLMLEEAAIIIGGGVGPMAGVALHAKIIEQTLTNGTDQTHLTVFHHSCSPSIADRTEYLDALRNGNKASLPNPGEAMAEVFTRACTLPFEGGFVGGVPCNTFHAPAIFDQFHASLHERRCPVRLVHMLDETIGLIGARLGKAPGEKGNGETIGLLATLGTRFSGVYDALLHKAGYRPLHLSPEDNARLHEAIYNREWGIKAVSPVTGAAAARVAEMAGKLAETGAGVVILGCTELPLALPGERFGTALLVDPVQALARALVREAAPHKLRPTV